jgi:hypothetical protein
MKQWATAAYKQGREECSQSPKTETDYLGLNEARDNGDEALLSGGNVARSVALKLDLITDDS